MPAATRTASVLVAALLSLLVAACGSGGAATSAAPAANTPAVPEERPVLPVTVRDASDHEVTVRSVDRIVAVNGDLTEVVFALGLGDRLVARDLSATYPPEVEALPSVGYQRALVAETVLSFEPDVVLASSLAGPPGAVDELRRTGVPVVLVDRPADLSGPAAKIRAVGAALGVPGRGEALARDVEAEIEAATVATRDERADRPRVAVLYLRGDRVQLVFGEGSGTDAIVEAAGGVDVGTQLGIGESGELSLEALIAADPDVFLVSTSGLESAGGVDGLLSQPGLARTSAGRDRWVLAYEDQYLLGLGPRTGKLLGELAAALRAGPPGHAGDLGEGDRTGDDAATDAPGGAAEPDGAPRGDGEIAPGAEQQAADVFATVFDSSVPWADKVPLIQGSDDPALRAAHDGYLRTAEGVRGVRFDVRDVEVAGDTAQIDFDILFNGVAAYRDQEGAAVRAGDGWQVGRDEFCGLMALARNPCG